MIYLSFKNMVEDDAQRFIVANFEDGLREMELCEAVIKSAKKDRWVKVGE